MSGFGWTNKYYHINIDDFKDVTDDIIHEGRKRKGKIVYFKIIMEDDKGFSQTMSSTKEAQRKYEEYKEGLDD